MLVGLVLLRRGGSGSFGVTLIILKQVWWRSSTLCRSFKLSKLSFLLKGVVWVLLALFSEGPQVVSRALLSCSSPVCLSLLYILGGGYDEFEW